VVWTCQHVGSGGPVQVNSTGGMPKLTRSVAARVDLRRLKCRPPNSNGAMATTARGIVPNTKGSNAVTPNRKLAVDYD
jgi:hypothetical protein